MALTSRVLPFEEWGRLADTDLGPCLGAMQEHPEKVQVLVVEDDGVIVAHWAVLFVLHAEGIWIAPAYRKRVGVGRRLWKAMHEAARTVGAERFWTCADRLEVRRLIVDHLKGIPIPAESFVVSLRG